jgi:transposase InsO family protein
MRLSIEIRSLIGTAVDRVGNKSLVSKVVGVTRKTVSKWAKRRKHLKDRKRKAKKSKITMEVELSIIGLRNMCGWGTARIKQNLDSAPEYLIQEMPFLVQGIKLSRTAINNVLKEHKLNGYLNERKGWKFFRAKKPNELWQLDPKGVYTIQGKKYWFVICIDDYSRYMIMATYFDQAPTCEDIQKKLLPLIKKHKPKKILTDNNPFKNKWNKWCKEQGIEPLHAHPYYPQDKGKVERAIRTISEEFIYLIKKFPHWLDGVIQNYQEWYNQKRFHLGIQNFPAQLYT